MKLISRIRTLARVRPLPEGDLPEVAETVAIIMDGNGRWARRRGMPAGYGHREGTRALRRILGDHIESAGFACATDLLMKAATSAPYEGRPMYAALRAIPVPDDVVARLRGRGATSANVVGWRGRRFHVSSPSKRCAARHG